MRGARSPLHRLLGAAALLVLLGAAAPPSPQVLAELAPDGTLHAAINYGNPILAQARPAAGAPHGISAGLARALAQRLGVKLAFVIFHEAGAVSAALHADPQAWDVAFLAVDPVRAREIAFTAPYVVIEGTYLVRDDAPLRTIADADRAGVRIAVSQGSAYDLYLTRTLTQAQLVRLPDSTQALDAFLQRPLDALAGIRQPLIATAESRPGLRVVPGRFMEIAQAMAVPAGRPEALRYLRGFVEEMKASGFVAAELTASGQTSAAVAPAEAP